MGSTLDTVTIVVNSSQGRRSVPAWAKQSYGIEAEQLVSIEKRGGDGYHETYLVRYRKSAP